MSDERFMCCNDETCSDACECDQHECEVFDARYRCNELSGALESMGGRLRWITFRCKLPIDHPGAPRDGHEWQVWPGSAETVA